MFPTMQYEDFSSNVFDHAVAETNFLRAGVLCSHSVTSLYVRVMWVTGFY